MLNGALAASRGAAAVSRHRRDSCPSDEVVGGFNFDFEAVRTASRHRDAPRRFPSSKLNFAENLLRHGKGPLANEEAVITVSEGMGRKAWTFAELRRDAGRVQRALSKLGVDSSESCGAYIANVGEAVVAMLGATATGATWTSCSPDFGARAVADRFGQVGPKVLFASDGA